MIVSASDTVMAGGIKFELDDTTMVALVAGLMVAGYIAGGGTRNSVQKSYADFVDVARVIVAETKKTPKEGG